MVADKKPLQNWHQGKVGARLIATEAEKLSKILATIYGYHLIFIGDQDLSALVEVSLISHQVLVNPEARSSKTKISCLAAEFEELPIASDSVDVVVLVHILESAFNPHEILREAHRILIPEGHIIITGLNPYSLWGIWHRYKKLIRSFSPPVKLLSMNRMKDWLQLLNFQIIQGEQFHFRPPIGRGSFYEKFRFFEKMGRTCWPFWGGAYVLQAIKRVIPLTPVKPRFRKVKEVWQPQEGIPKPTTHISSERQK